MDGAFDIPDSTDWLNTPLKDFSTLENALHCQICKEFYDTPMITSCAHTFCSKCIRTSLSTDGKCPACRTTDQASKLRNNWALQEVVSNFLAARPAALEVARRARDVEDQARKPAKRKRTIPDSDDNVQVEQDAERTTRSKSRRLAASQSSQPDTIEIVDSDGDGDFEPEELKSDGLVECPLGCGKRMKIEAVEPHLDRCEDERKQASRAKSSTPTNGFPSSRKSSSQVAKPQDRISELNYSLLNEAKLRKKLEDLGMPAWGNKSLLIKRHTEWVNLWNANCDSNHPRTKRELLHDLDTWERTQGGRAPNPNGLANTVMRKDFDGAGWANRNRDDFSRLIAEAKRKKSYPALEEEQAKDARIPEGVDALTLSEPEQAVLDLSPMDKPSEEPMFHETANGTVDVPPAKAETVHLQVNNIENAATSATATPPLGPPISSRSDSGAARPVHSQENPVTLEQNRFGALRAGSQDEHLGNGVTGSPCEIPAHLQSGSVKKMPMFEMPRIPVTDVDAGGGSTGP